MTICSVLFVTGCDMNIGLHRYYPVLANITKSRCNGPTTMNMLLNLGQHLTNQIKNYYILLREQANLF